jgi:ribonuclease BN (tRNA processing enzyme)
MDLGTVNPLFDLVAASVQSKRPPKKTLNAVELPPDVKAFITGYNQARFNKIDAILLTHLHGDHYGGIPFFLLDAMLAAKRTSPLTIYTHA